MLGLKKGFLLLILTAIVVSGCEPKRNSMVIEQQIIDALRNENKQLRNALDKAKQGDVIRPISLVDENISSITEPKQPSSAVNLSDDQVVSSRDVTDVTPKADANYNTGNENWEAKLHIYFPAGGAYITRSMQDSIDVFVQNYTQKFPDQPIRLEGYADHRGLRNELLEKYGNNWVLAAARGAAVANYLRWAHNISSSNFEVICRVTSREKVRMSNVYETQSDFRKVVLSVLQPAE